MSTEPLAPDDGTDRRRPDGADDISVDRSRTSG